MFKTKRLGLGAWDLRLSKALWHRGQVKSPSQKEATPLDMVLFHPKPVNPSAELGCQWPWALDTLSPKPLEPDSMNTNAASQDHEKGKADTQTLEWRPNRRSVGEMVSYVRATEVLRAVRGEVEVCQIYDTRGCKMSRPMLVALKP